MLHGFPGLLKNEDMAAEFCRRGMTVLAPSYGGCWGSPGCFSIRGAFEDARAALRLLSRYPRVDAGRIGILGYSFGGWAALRLAAEQRVAAAAVLAPAVPHGNFAADARYLRRHAKAVRLGSLEEVWSEYAAVCAEDRPGVYVGAISPAPLLIVQGLRDRLVAPEGAAGLWALAGRPRKLIVFPEEDHEFQNDRRAVVSAVCGWLESNLAAAPSDVRRMFRRARAPAVVS
ncbi:MAG TPA: alpha/beta fold hydrolase [Elusimicrobiota bacterium]|jgi:dipeptidyl aminopeptidase/acylaminoacyl peptidase|nr:alpha/beta fold hydrolase [Elusimicrobiota bacterium]